MKGVKTSVDVARRVRVIGELVSRGDDLIAHREEDLLYQMVLESIARSEPGDEGPREMAREALKTRLIQFNRWCA